MGKYLNPGNCGFQEMLRSEYVDKTGLIDLINRTIGTKQKLTCVSRPRRFGKSYAVQMLCAYYDDSCESRELFADKEIADTEHYAAHLNKYHVVNLDISGFLSDALKSGKDPGEVPLMIEEAIYKEMITIYPELSKETGLSDCFLRCVEKTGRKFLFIIDEWDALIRETKDDAAAQRRYLNLLREWFKNNNFTPQVVAAAYMTGILPIKKDSSQSAISDFREYSVLDPGDFARYTGFTEKEVKKLCVKYDMNFEIARKWYDGYTFWEANSIYNPYSVMCAIEKRRFESFWKKTSAAEALQTYIDMDEDGLQEDIARLIAGETIDVDTDGFQNDFASFESKDDVLTLLVHLGYLTYEEDRTGYGEEAEGEPLRGTVRIPNEEVRIEFHKLIHKGKHKKLVELVSLSDQLLSDTLAGNEDKVATAFEKVRASEYSPNYYNNEQALRYAIKFAYLSCVDQYAKMEELPSGHGIADVVFVPKRRSALPAMVIELKWNKSAEGALHQIKEKKYPAVLKKYGAEVVLVGVNYDVKSKRHTCKIEKIGNCSVD